MEYIQFLVKLDLREISKKLENWKWEMLLKKSKFQKMEILSYHYLKTKLKNGILFLIGNILI